MFSLATILSALTAYFAVFFGIGWFLRKWGSTKQKYLLADRRAGLMECTLLVAGCWTAGLTMIVPPQQAYLNGWVSWTWFTYPQLLGMLIFSWFSTVIYKKIRSGYTISSYINKRYGNQVSFLYQLVFCFSGLGLILTTFTAVLKFLAFIKADNPALVTAIIVVCTVVYSWKGGIKTSLVTGSVQTVLTTLLLIALCVWGIGNQGWNAFSRSLTGLNHVTNFFDWKLLTTFALTSAMTLITGPLMSPSHHQKSFAQDNDISWKAWIRGGWFYCILIQLPVGILGTLALGYGTKSADSSVVHWVYLQDALGIGALALMAVVILNTACTILDSHGNAAATIVAHDWTKNEKYSTLVSRLTLAVLGLIAWIVSTYNFDITYIFFTYSTVRVNLFIITMLSVATDKLNQQGILYSNVVLIPVTLWMGLHGLWYKAPEWNLYAAAIAMFGTPGLAYLISQATRIGAASGDGEPLSEVQRSSGLG
jgi:Na+/proline symporter